MYTLMVFNVILIITYWEVHMYPFYYPFDQNYFQPAANQYSPDFSNYFGPDPPKLNDKY